VTSARADADLRTGRWTRFGGSAVRGDGATEATLSGLVDRARAAARAQGYAAGWAEGRQVALASAVADEQQRAEVRGLAHAQAVADQDAATAALQRVVDGYADSAAGVLDDLAGSTVALALQLAEAILGREVATAADPGADALRRALVAVPPAVAVTVRLHPDDRAALDPAVLDGRPVTFVDDPALERGDAVVETDTGVVDATLRGALARVLEVLS
jgi:flagellar assembly protein FliH